MTKYKPLYALYKGLKEHGTDLPDSYGSFERSMTQAGNAGASNRRNFYQSLKDSNYDVPDTYEKFYESMFVPVNNTTSRARKIGETPMTEEDRKGFTLGAQDIRMNASKFAAGDALRYNKLKQRKQKQRKDFGRVKVGTNKTPYAPTDNVVKDEGLNTYVTSDSSDTTNLDYAQQKQAVLDEQNQAYMNAIERGDIPMASETIDKNGLYDLQENIGKDGTEVTEKGIKEQAEARLNVAYQKQKDIMAQLSAAMDGGFSTFEERMQLSATKNKIDEEVRNLEALAGKESSGFWNTLADVANTIPLLHNIKEGINYLFGDDTSKDMYKAIANSMVQSNWDFGVSDIQNSVKLEQIRDKINKGEAVTKEEKEFLDANQKADKSAEWVDQYGSRAYRWTSGAGVSVPYMIDFYITGGLPLMRGMTQAFGRGAMKIAAKRGWGKLAHNIMYYTGVAAGDIIGSYAMATTVQGLKTGSDVLNRHLGTLYQDEKGNYAFGTFDENGNLLHEGGESFGKALYKGVTAAMLENYTEKMFGHWHLKSGAFDLLDKNPYTKKLADFFRGVGNKNWYLDTKKFSSKFGIGSYPEEVAEEIVNIPLNAWLVGDNSIKELGDRKTWEDIAGSMAISVGSMAGMASTPHIVRGAANQGIKAYDFAAFYVFKNRLNQANQRASEILGDEWEVIKNRIDSAPNENLGKISADLHKQVSEGKYSEEQLDAAWAYIQNLRVMRGYNLAKTMEMQAKAMTGDENTPADIRQKQLNAAYAAGQETEGENKHLAQVEYEKQKFNLASALGVSDSELENMTDEQISSNLGLDDNLDNVIYNYQNAKALYDGIMDNAQNAVDTATKVAAQRVDAMTNVEDGTIKQALVKGTMGKDDYPVYVISGNIETHDDGIINYSDSDSMIIVYNVATGRKETIPVSMLSAVNPYIQNAEEFKAQAVNEAKEKTITELSNVIDGKLVDGSQFTMEDAQGQIHEYKIEGIDEQGNCIISVDGTILPEPLSLDAIQQQYDQSNVARSVKNDQTAQEPEQIQQEAQPIEDKFDYAKITNENDGKVKRVDVTDEEGKNRFPNAKAVFLIQDKGAMPKFVVMDEEGNLTSYVGKRGDKIHLKGEMTIDEYKKQRQEGLQMIAAENADSSMIEENSGAIEVEDNEEGKLLNRNDDGAQTEQNQPSASVTTSQEDAAGSSESKDTNISANGNENNESLTFEDGTPIPVDVNGEVDLSQTDATHAAEWYDNNLGEDADDWLDGEIKKAKKVLEQAKNKKLAGTKPSELVASKKEKEAAIADAQAHYDSAISIRDSLKERRIAKEENTSEGRRNLIEKARRKFARLKSAVKDDAEAVSQLYRETIGSLLHRLYDGTGIDVTDTIPLTAEEYVASNLGAHSLNYEGTETSKGVKQETGLSREDFAKTQLLAADGKGTTIDALVHSLWENRPSNLESLDTQDIRNALIGVLNSSFKASEARNFVENIRIAQAENILEEKKRAQENAAYAEQHKAEPEAELKAKSDEKAELKAKLDNESSNESNDLSNETDNDLDNEKTNDNINDNINTPEVPEDATEENPLGAQRDSAPFSPKDNTKVTNSSEERKAMVKKNAVRSEDVLDHSIGKKMRKSLSRIAKMMGADIIYLHSADSNGWYDEKTNTIYLALDSADVLGTQFVFGHEMTHEIKAKNPAAFEELKNLVKNMMGEDAFNTITDKTQQKYEKGGATYWKDRNAMEEEVVADQIGNWIHDANYAHTLMMKMSHPLLAKLHEIVNRIRFAFTGTEYSDNAKLILRSIEQAYMKTANGQVTNSETGEDVSFSLRQKPEPKKKGIGYKVFVLKDGKLYPPMVANPNGAATPVGVWLDADAAPIAGESKTGRPQVKQGGKGTQGGSGKLAYRPGWHLGVVPYAIQFNRKDAEGNKTLFPKNFVFAEVEYAADVDYQEEARQEGINPSGKYQHSLAGLKHLPTDGYYMYRTNPNPETDPWVITGAMKVNRILTRAEQADLVSKAGREPQQIQEGDIVTDDVVNSINQEIADAPKFSLKDNQENPLNQDGTLKLDKIKSVDELTDEDFTSAFRNVELPAIPKNVDAAIGANGKPIVIKKNIFEKNWNAHKFTPAESKKVLNDALYNTDLVGHTQPTKKPNHWVAIKLDDKSPITVLEVNDNKNNVEVVGWYTLDERNLGRIKRQAERNGGELIMLTPKDDKVESLSTPPLSSAAKIDNSSETAKENGEKFSLKNEKTMFGMHNISVDKLRKAIKQGGFAAPSMGVVDSKNGIYSDYGEITLIPKAEKLAKRTGKNAGTFTADAWTPTYPQVERIMNKQGEKAFNTDMNVKLGDVDNGIYSNVRESWKGYLSSGDVRDGLYWHYLFDNGMNPETIYQTGKYDNDITNEVMRISDNGNKTDYTDKEVAELIQLMNKATGKDNDVDAQREKLKARIASAEKQGNHLLVALKKKRLEELEGVENFYIAADFVNDVVRNNRKNGKVDVHDTMGTAKKKVEDNKKLSDDFPSWLDKKTEEYGVEEMLYNGTTPSGKPKYIPNTIENAVKLMKKQGVAGGYTAFGSELGVFIAKNSPEVNTLAAMKNAKDKLIPFGDERHNQIKDKITKEFLELSDEIRVGSNNRYAFDDSGVSRMVELTDHKGNEKEYLKKAYNIEVSDEWMDRYNKLLDTIKKDYKVFYFETKFMRPYGLDEFEKAIVPSDTPSDVIDALKKAGIDVSSYERGNAEDRQKVTMDAINSSDNIRFSLAGERGAAAADKAEERTFRMDNLSVARKMEEKKKDAKAIKMATGWERGADGKWRYEMPDAKIKDTMDVGGGHIVKRYEDDMLWNGGKLSDVIDAPELFKAYPQLKGVRIDTDAIMNDMPSHGEYDSKTNTITIHADELKYMNDILNHEIQHAIQGIEGFATGGSPTTIRGEVKKRFNEVTKQIKQLRAEGKEDEAKALIEKNRGLYDAYMKNDDFNSYKSLAGEVEARNVQERMNMTPEERRKTLAESTEDVARKDQIFLGVGDVSFSLRDMADGKESGAADMAEDLKSLNTPDEVDDAIKTAIEDMPSGWKMANKKMIHIAQALGENRKAEIAGEEPKFSLKDGTLIKAGTYFSGGGLVEEGLKGIIDPVVAVEYDEKISGVYRNNFGQHIVTADVRDVDPKELVKQIDGEVEYFHASPVCKNYSQAKSNHAEVELDKETAASTAEFINAVKPRVVTIENVKGYKDSDAMKIITDALDANGYTWDADVYNAADYGGYTNRERLIVRAVRDGKLPAKPEKMARKSGWYEAVADIIPTLTEKKNGVAPWMDIRLKADGIDWRNIDKPLYVMGSAYADGKVPHAFADELLPTLRTKSGDVIVMPDGKVYRAMGRVLARVSGVSDDYKMPFSENLSHTIIGNGIPTQLTEHVIAPLLQNILRPTTPDEGNTKFSLRGSTPYGKQMEEWMEKNHLEKGAVPMEKPIMKEGENIFDYANRMVEWTRNQNLWKTAPKQTGFQDALDKWKADNGLSPDAYPPVRPHRENYSTEIGYAEDLEEYNKKKELWKSAPKPKNFDLSVDLEDMNKQLRNIRRAVLNQKNYDQRTVKAVSDLVRKMLNIGWGDGLSRGKVGNLLSAAKNATGANDVKKYLDKAMGILAENYLNRLSTAYDNLINTKGARADQSGVIKMSSLDANGQAFMSEYKKAINMDDSSLNTYIANIEEDSAKNEDNVEMNDYRLAGIQAAIMYKQQIGGNDADIAELKRQIGELKNKKDATKEDKDLLKSLEKKLFENKFDRITMYENLLNNIQRMVKESKGRAKEFREEITEHKNEILHRANLDLEGVDSTYYDTTTAKKKLVNNDLQRAVFSSTYTFEQFLKFFGKKAANGEGYLYNYFSKLNQDALDEEQLYNEMNRNALDEKTKELFGKEKFMKLVGIDGKGMKEMDVEVTDYSNKETGKRTIHLKQGQMLYIYLVNKETDGEMKLRAMGITEEDVAAIEENLDPRVKAMGEWLQDEYLPECQRRYQATHTKYFGAPMKEVENYFPLAINNRARNVKEDVNQDSDAMSQLAGTSTGAIVTRRVNVIPLDIENADAFEVAFNHLQEMEEWSAMLPFRQDINTLLSYTHFRNQVQNMSSVAYGSGKTLWDEFKQTAQIAAGTYKPKVNAGMMDSRIAAAMGGIAVAKISGRLWTAIKQSQSATVFLPECDFTRFVKNGVNPYGSWKWAMENIPDFRKRVENMTYGDVKLRQYLDELEKWHDWTKTISKIGMAPNILVDGITCAVGARSVYETEVNRLTKLGYPKEKAEEKAYYKAVAAYNKTQQSSGGMYLSPMQVDRTYVSAALSLFKNANYAYGRMQIEACRGLARTYDLWGGKHKTTLIESMTRQIMEEDGLDENTARAIAKATYNRTFRQSIGRLINFATLVPVSWALYKVLPYLLTGDDDDKKKDMIEEAVLKGFATSLSDNYVIPFVSNILNAGLKVEDGKPTFDPEVFRYQNLYINPATSDLANIYSMIGNQKWYSVANKLGMLGVQSLIGFNPETVGALYQAVSEADYDNGNTAKEWQIGILKAISAPEESIRELYMDELGLKSGDKDAMKKLMSLAGLDADDINKVPLAELEKRYAERQINRDNLLSQIGMDAETFNGYVDKYQKSFEKKIKDKMDKWDEYDKKKADEFFDTTSDPKLKDMIEKKRAKDANAAADEQIAKEGLNQEKKGKEPSEEAYDAVKMSIDVAEDNAISTYNKVLNKRYAALNDEYNNQTDAMKYIFMSKHPNFKSYKNLESEYTTYGKKMKELKEKLVSADRYDAKQTILKQIRVEREKFSELQSKVR